MVQLYIIEESVVVAETSLRADELEQDEKTNDVLIAITAINIILFIVLIL
jgi:hypothetical protein